jgi:DNA-directed RNA polymerase subunit RPC12/RpoP
MSDSNTPQRRVSGSGIQFEKGPLANEAGLTATVTLSRKAAMAQAVTNMIYAVASQEDVACPRCSAAFDVTPQLYNAIAECPDCGLTFVIKPPGAAPYRGPIPGATIQAPQHTVAPHGMPGRPGGMPGGMSAPAMPRPAAVPPRMNTSGITISAQPLEGEDMMSTIEIQRSSRGLQQSLKQGISSTDGDPVPTPAPAPATPMPQVNANRPAVRHVVPPAVVAPPPAAMAPPPIRGQRPGAAMAMPAMHAPPAVLPQQGSVPPEIAQQATQRTNASGIAVDKRVNDYGLTATVTLSRKGMGMAPQSKTPGRPDAPVTRSRPQAQLDNHNRMAYAVATATDVACPGCGSRFDATAEMYNATVECPDCQSEFIIRPPGTPLTGSAPARSVAMPQAPTPSQMQTSTGPRQAAAAAAATNLRMPVQGSALAPSRPPPPLPATGRSPIRSRRPRPRAAQRSPAP